VAKIELGDEREEARGRRAQVAPELGDLGFEAVESAVARARVGERGNGRRRSRDLVVHVLDSVAGWITSNMPESSRQIKSLLSILWTVEGLAFVPYRAPGFRRL
jgi:hypothetical protein